LLERLKISKIKRMSKNNWASVMFFQIPLFSIITVVCLNVAVGNEIPILNTLFPTTKKITKNKINNFEHYKADIISSNILDKYTDTLNNLIFSPMLLHEYGIRFPNVVFYQNFLETSHCKNKNSLCYNDDFNEWNLFGMKHPKIRFTYSIGKTKKGHAIFKNAHYSILDYKIWQDLYIPKHIKTEYEYIRYLKKKHYCEKNDYYDNLIKLIKQNKEKITLIPTI
jgi:hypothetical protein